MRTGRGAAVAVAVVAIAALSGCGARSAGEPPALRLAGEPGAAATAEAAADAGSGDDVALFAPVEHVFDASALAPLEAGTVSAWQLERPADPGDVARRLATGFDLEADDVQAQGDSAFIEDGKRMLRVGAAGHWHFFDAGEQVAVGCPSEEAGGGSEPANPKLSGDDVGTLDAGGCDDPDAPGDVPTAGEAEQATRALFEEVETPGPVVGLSSHASDRAANVEGRIEVDGRPSSLRVHVVFGAGGGVVTAGGMAGELVEVPGYPTVDLAAAVERLTGNPMGVPDRTLDHGDVSVTSPGLPADTPVSDGGEAGHDGAAPLPEPGAEPEPLPQPEPQPAPEPQEVEVVLVDVELDSMTVTDIEGTTWLVPAYRFDDSDGGAWQVLAIAEGYLEVEDPGAPEPLPAPGPLPEPGRAPQEAGVTDGAAPDDEDDRDMEELARDVVGLAEQDALERLEAAGATVRVIARDGEELTRTQDLRLDRVNLHIDGGVVSDASVG